MSYLSFVNAILAVPAARRECQKHIVTMEAVEAVVNENSYKIGLMLVHLDGCEACRSINIPLGGGRVPLQNFTQFWVFATDDDRRVVADLLNGNVGLDPDELAAIMSDLSTFAPGPDNVQSDNLQIHILMAALGEDLKARYSANGMTFA